MLKGVLCSLGANILFGVGYYFAVLLQPLTDMAIFGWRILVLMPFILLAIVLFKQQRTFYTLLQKIRQKPSLVIILLLLSFNTGLQLWLFMWAPTHNQAIQVSIGYLLLPIVAVALGKIVFKEQFSLLKWLAISFAFIGVVSNIILTGTVSWATFVAGFGYPIYIALRRYFQINTLATFFVELLLLLPFALYYATTVEMASIQAQNTMIYGYLALLGLVNGVAFILYIASSDLLPINVLGLLGYAEPLIMLLISLMIGEQLDSQSIFLMICLAGAISLLTLDSFRSRI